MPLEDIAEIPDPADQLRADIESAIEGQHREAPAESAESTDTESSPETPAEGRERDAQGRFIARAETAEVPASETPEAPVEPKVETPASDAAKTTPRPPPGFSVASKAAWDKETPSPEEWAAAKVDIAKREQEVDNGFKRYSGLGKFAEEAERNGTTLQGAVSDYVAVEGALRQNFVGGIEFLCQKMGINPRQLAQAMSTRYAPTGQTTQPDAPQATQVPTQPPIDPRAIAEHVANVLRTEGENKDASAKVDVFMADPKNKYFANVRQDMAILVQTGKASNLDQAYEAACWLNPEIRSIMINETNGGRNREAAVAASRSRTAAKAVGGSPAPGVNPDATTHRKNLSLEDEIRAAVDAQSGAA